MCQLQKKNPLIQVNSFEVRSINRCGELLCGHKKMSEKYIVDDGFLEFLSVFFF